MLSPPSARLFDYGHCRFLKKFEQHLSACDHIRQGIGVIFTDLRASEDNGRGLETDKKRRDSFLWKRSDGQYDDGNHDTVSCLKY